MKRFCLLLGVALTLSAQAPEDDWAKRTTLPGVDLTGMSAPQREALLQTLRKESCPCGCTMKIAECRVKDPDCSVSRGLSLQASEAAKAGKPPEKVRAVIADAVRARMLGSAVPIPIDGAPSKGPANARVTIVEFSDFQCPYCSVAAGKVTELQAMYPKDVRVVFKQYPLDNHSKARIAAEASLAANAQGKFWALHDRMYQHFREITEARITEWAKESGLEMSRFQADMQSGKYRAQVEKDIADGDVAGVQGTPTFYINGKQYRGAFEPALVKPLIDAELK